MSQQGNVVLVEVSVEELAPAPFVTSNGHQGQAAILRGRSPVSELCFRKTVYVGEKSLDNIRMLQEHGSVAVALSQRWLYEYDTAGGWLQYVLDEAIKIVTSIKQSTGGNDMAEGFDQMLAKKILHLLDEIYPSSFRSPVELKAALGNLPDDRALMTALDALLCDGLILGKDLRDYTSGERRLVMLAMIQISREGRQSLRVAPPSQGAVVHGDQYVNYGYLGAAGRGSTGSIVNGQSSSPSDALGALDALLSSLQALPQRTPEVERAGREFHKVRDEIADEQEPDQTSVTKWLTRGKQLLATAALGHEVIEAAETVYKIFGIQ